MNNKQFYDELTKRVKTHLGTLRDLQAAMKADEAKSKDAKFSEAYRKQFADKLPQFRLAIERALYEANADVESLIRDYAAERRSLDALNGADITDDVRVLTAGVTLKPRDYMALLDRNRGNGTMEQLIIRHAKEHKVDLGRGVRYTGHEYEARNIEATLYTASMVLNRYEHSDAAYFDKLLGEGSQLHQLFGTE